MVMSQEMQLSLVINKFSFHILILYLRKFPFSFLFFVWCIGKTLDGENLYMGRCLHEGTLTPGKVQQSHGCLYIPFNGEEISVKEYDVLVLK